MGRLLQFPKASFAEQREVAYDGRFPTMQSVVRQT